MIERVPTGIKELDKIIGGGIVKPSSLLIQGPPGSGKSIFMWQLLYEGIQRGEGCISAITGEYIPLLKEKLKTFNWDIEKYKEKVKIIDCYSWRLGARAVGRRFSISGPADLNQVSVAISEAKTELEKSGNSNVRVAIDSLSDFFLFNEPIIVYKFLEILIARIKAENSILILVLDEGLHDEKVINTVKYLVDSVICLKQGDDGRYMRIEKMILTKHTTAWIPFDIEENGIKILR